MSVINSVLWRANPLRLAHAFALAADITWTGANSSDWNNPTHWSPASVPTAGDHVIINSGSVTMPANVAYAVMDWSGGTITNAGLIRWSGAGDLQTHPPTSTLDNLSGGRFEVQNDRTITQLFPANGAGLFRNAGLFLKSDDSGTTSVSLPSTNTVTLEAQTDTIRLPTTYTNSPTATAAVSLGGATPGSGYGRIEFTSPAVLSGNLAVSTRNGYRPNPGDTFVVFSYPAATNTFVCLRGQDLGGGILLQPKYTPGSLVLTATACATNIAQPQLFINRTLGGLAITWPAVPPGVVLLGTTNAAAPFWLPVPGQCQNQAFVPVTLREQFFRLSNTQ